MTDKEGDDFSLWGGDIFGTNTKVIRHQLLEQDWYSGGAWPKPSKLSFKFKADKDTTVVELDHQEVPEETVKSIESGWREYYMGPLKKLVEA